MKRALPTLLDTLFLLAFAVWLGGVCCMILAAAPAVFNAYAPDKARAASVVVEILNRLGGAIEISGVAMVGIEYLVRRRYMRNRGTMVADGFRQLLTFGALLMAEYVRYVLLPGLTRFDAPTFRGGYGLATFLTLIEVPFLVAIAGLTAWLELTSPNRADFA